MGIHKVQKQPHRYIDDVAGHAHCHPWKAQVPDPSATLLAKLYFTVNVSTVPCPVYLNFLPALACSIYHCRVLAWTVAPALPICRYPHTSGNRLTAPKTLTMSSLSSVTVSVSFTSSPAS